MSPLTYMMAEEDGRASITVIFPGSVEPKIALDSHPNFEKILTGARAKDETIKDLFDISETIDKYFDNLSERVAVKNGRLYFDGDEVDNGLTKQVLRFLDEGVDNWLPLVNFFEKVQTNTNEHSREQLYGFVERNEISITPDGDVVFYKGVNKGTDEGGNDVYTALNSGHGIVDGEELFDSYLPQYIGSTVEIPRKEVKHDPHAACHVGLHAATFDFARSFVNYSDNSAVLEVHVNPRDVVSVPHHADKIRCCRYVVIGEAEQSHTSPLVGQVSVSNLSLDDEDDFSVEPENNFYHLGISFVKALDNIEGEAFEAENNPTLTNPSPEEWEALRDKAKRQKKGIPAVAKGSGWGYAGGDTKDRHNYIKI